jgi:hypothetical protein
MKAKHYSREERALLYKELYKSYRIAIETGARAPGLCQSLAYLGVDEAFDLPEMRFVKGFRVGRGNFWWKRENEEDRLWLRATVAHDMFTLASGGFSRWEKVKLWFHYKFHKRRLLNQ